MPHLPFLPILSKALVALWLSCGAGWAGDLTVFAAASLKTALEEVARDYQERTDTAVVMSFAGSSALARQIGFGAPVDVFVSANTDWMENLEARGLIAPPGPVTLLSNRLVVVAPASQPHPLQLSELPRALGDGRLAMALVSAVPAGIYGKAALSHLELWEPLRDRVAQADNVRAALALVAAAEARFGIVYATDALAEPRVAVVADIPPEAHPPISYPAARILRRDAHPQAQAFLDHLSSDAAQELFRRHGFLSVPAP